MILGAADWRGRGQLTTPPTTVAPYNVTATGHVANSGATLAV
jgi:hypothetical protein